MSSDALLSVEPQHLQFECKLVTQAPFVSSKLRSDMIQFVSLSLVNSSDGNFVAFKVKTTNPKKYCVRPNIGVVPQRSSFEVVVTMQAQEEAPPDLQCRDKFLLQSVVASQGVTAKDVTPDMFLKESGRRVEETKLKVVYVPPAQRSLIREEAGETVSPAVSVADNGSYNLTESKPLSH